MQAILVFDEYEDGDYAFGLVNLDLLWQYSADTEVAIKWLEVARLTDDKSISIDADEEAGLQLIQSIGERIGVDFILTPPVYGVTVVDQVEFYFQPA